MPIHHDDIAELEALETSRAVRWLKTTQVAQRMGQSRETVRRMCEAGSFPGAYRLTLGGHWRVPESDVEAILQPTRPLRGRTRR